MSRARGLEVLRRRLREKRVSVRRAWTDQVKASQETRGIYRSSQGDREFGDRTAEINLRLFGVRGVGSRDTLPIVQQSAIMQAERKDIVQQGESQ